MPNLATWLREKDEKWFQAFFVRHPEIQVRNARTGEVNIAETNGLLLTGGSDVAPEFLRQEIPDPNLIEDVDLGGTLKLDIPGHRAPEMKDNDVQPLRNDRAASHRFEKVNSSHHQALDSLGEHVAVESWCA